MSQSELSMDYTIDTLPLEPERDMSREEVNNIDSSSFLYYKCIAWQEMMEEQDASWVTQDTHSLNGMIPYGRYIFNDWFYDYNEKMDGALEFFYNRVRDIAKSKANSISMDFDMSIRYNDLEEETREIEVPREVRVGLFKKETRLEKQIQTSFVKKSKLIRFKAWRLAHFERIYQFLSADSPKQGYKKYTNWDYCLGEDGELYMVCTSYRDWNDWEGKKSGADYSCVVRSLIPFNNMLYGNKNQNVFIAVSHGLIYALDYIPLDYDKTETFSRGEETYTINFPLEIHESIVEPTEGIIERLNRLK